MAPTLNTANYFIISTTHNSIEVRSVVSEIKCGKKQNDGWTDGHDVSSMLSLHALCAKNK